MALNSNPIIIIQNRHDPILTQTKERLEVYRRILQRRLDLAEKNVDRIKIPHSRGLRLRLPGKQFHPSPEVFFQEGGRTNFDLPQETVTASSGEVMLVPAWMPHGERWSGKSFLNLIVAFHSEGFCLAFGYLEHGQSPLRCGPVDCFHCVDRFALIRYIEELAGVRGKDAVSRRLRQGLYMTLVARLIQGLNPSFLAKSVQDTWFSRCNEIINVYFCKMDFSITWLAQELGCSADHISRRFRAHTGHRIMETVHWRRIDLARRLLHDTNKNIAEIAWACGFSQPSYFNRIFKTLTGTTPKAFRLGTNRGRRSPNDEPAVQLQASRKVLR